MIILSALELELTAHNQINLASLTQHHTWPTLVYLPHKWVFEGCRRRRSWPILCHYYVIFLEGWGEQETFSPPSQDSNLGHPEYEAGQLSTHAMIMNCEKVRVWKETVVTCLQVL